MNGWAGGFLHIPEVKDELCDSAILYPMTFNLCIT